ncbi:sporulation protein YqfC [Paenibacillus swuensis]|uniref:Sporulation protein YqfC n=1 Tax=Paenibacillus swuensis TaxID=1178515 RepID=A0A172TKH3_9BACL|nr:sporulation protein YqfC [Paenibacillus swuensis]ANE47317.1 sporulation protein YqfC [Paenibacillus swuensis]
MRRINRRLRKFTANMLDLPQDVIFDLPRITLIGNMQLYIENHRGVSEFSGDMLRLSLSKGAMEIYGKNLVIRAILTEEMFVEGEVFGLKYLP